MDSWRPPNVYKDRTLHNSLWLIAHNCICPTHEKWSLPNFNYYYLPHDPRRINIKMSSMEQVAIAQEDLKVK